MNQVRVGLHLLSFPGARIDHEIKRRRDEKVVHAAPRFDIRGDICRGIPVRFEHVINQGFWPWVIGLVSHQQILAQRIKGGRYAGVGKTGVRGGGVTLREPRPFPCQPVEIGNDFNSLPHLTDQITPERFNLKKDDVGLLRHGA